MASQVSSQPLETMGFQRRSATRRCPKSGRSARLAAVEQHSLLAFPCDYPIKVMARVGPGLREQLDAIVRRHAADLDGSRISERPSAQQNFVGVTYIIRAHNAEQIAALFADLKTVESVLLVL